MPKSPNPHWEWPSRVGRRGGRPSQLQKDIEDTPWPVKPKKTVVAEEAVRLERADTVKRPEDAIPLQLHDSGPVDARGTPQLAEAFLRYVSGESAKTEEQRRLYTVLAELEQSHRVIWAVLAERYLYNRSEQEIASDIFLSQKTVSRMLVSGTQWLGNKLRGDEPIDTDLRLD